jgi:hypothetical protein
VKWDARWVLWVILALDVLFTVTLAVTVGRRRWVKVLYALLAIGFFVVCLFPSSLEKSGILPGWLGSTLSAKVGEAAILLYLGCTAWCVVEVFRVGLFWELLSTSLIFGGEQGCLVVLLGLAILISPLMLIVLAFQPSRRRCPQCKQWIIGEKGTTCPYCEDAGEPEYAYDGEYGDEVAL